MKLIKDKAQFRTAVRSYIALGGSQADQDQFRLEVIGSALLHGLRHANFDAGNRVAAATLGAIRPDVEQVMAECRSLWEANGKENLADEDAERESATLLEAVRVALQDVRMEQERTRHEKKQAKEAQARVEALARMEAEQVPQQATIPSPYTLKSPDGGTVDLNEEEFDLLIATLYEYRKPAAAKIAEAA